MYDTGSEQEAKAAAAKAAEPPAPAAIPAPDRQPPAARSPDQSLPAHSQAGPSTATSSPAVTTNFGKPQTQAEGTKKAAAQDSKQTTGSKSSSSQAKKAGKQQAKHEPGMSSLSTRSKNLTWTFNIQRFPIYMHWRLSDGIEENVHHVHTAALTAGFDKAAIFNAHSCLVRTSIRPVAFFLELLAWILSDFSGASNMTLLCQFPHMLDRLHPEHSCLESGRLHSHLCLNSCGVPASHASQSLEGYSPCHVQGCGRRSPAGTVIPRRRVVPKGQNTRLIHYQPITSPLP